ncbi:hypothetical protein [Pseudoalteromonas sp. S1688]|uniref:hypothetical protein n=1 Tax=Pseudoalteromonas sp. S1688 TaxID=579511 RepID=UPI00110A5592|nr:hypothetical protein [Pseudoalteromonas sp. S1688]TMP48725.1 hypothetical protein CWB81_16030 [Pseudoalteromonas sp. S1688]
MIPNSPEWSAINTVSDYPELDLVKPSPLFIDSEYDVSLGPINLNDSQGRLDSRYWFIYQNSDTNQILVCGAEDNQWGEPIELFNESGTVWEISLTFDQLGRPLVFYRISADTLKLYWYNPVLEQTELKVLAQGIDPNAGFDAPQDTGQSYSDAMLFYVRDNVIYMRIQRDRFETEYVTPSIGANVELRSSGMRVDNRYQVVYRHELTDYVPEPPVPPTPPVINGGYRYRLVFASYFLATGLDVQNPAVDPLEISFDITRSLTPEQKPFEQGTYGLLPECRDYALPIYSSGATLIKHPMLEDKVRFDNSKQVNAWTYVKRDPPIKINKRIAIEFIYGKDFKLKLFVCFNGRVTIIDMGQTPSGENRKLADGHYKLTFIDTTVSVYFNDELIMQSEFDRGSNFTEQQPIQTLIGGTNFTQRYLFKGCMFNLAVKTSEVDALFKLDQKNELVQTPQTGSSFLEIINHRRANWAYYIV